MMTPIAETSKEYQSSISSSAANSKIKSSSSNATSAGSILSSTVRNNDTQLFSISEGGPSVTIGLVP